MSTKLHSRIRDSGRNENDEGLGRQSRRIQAKLLLRRTVLHTPKLVRDTSELLAGSENTRLQVKIQIPPTAQPPPKSNFPQSLGMQL